MRAIVLMCLLHAAIAVAPTFPWNGIGNGIQTPNPNAKTNSACATDEGSCRCCVMLKEMNRLRMYFNTTMNNLEKEFSQMVQSLDNIQASYTAVSVALFNEFKCLGPNQFNTLVIYKHVFINLGNGYSVDTGIFTVPRSGVYSLALTVYSDSGSPGAKLAACASLLLNGQLVAGTREINMEDQEDSGTTVVALHLKAGDKVTVNLPAGCYLCDDSNHYNTFSAFLLYPE
ncbi:complement C1q-like protein 4 [Etheostoma cragini]|uniref:complement C1q-like protein 4 n=1 Tax=Etheostoma cragini TaxID=417921 RepID=UPI00155EE684|nr:complement C1q-like protein 4 [Etheostoma cragini]